MFVDRLKCNEAQELASLWMDQQIPLLKRIRLNIHLLLCDMCRNYVRHILLIRQIARQAIHKIDFWEDSKIGMTALAKERIKRKLKGLSVERGAENSHRKDSL